LHIHFHTLAVDGVFEKHGDGVRLHEAKPPEKADVASVVRRVYERALRWLGKHKHLDDRPAEERSNEPPATTPIDAFASIALGGGTFLGKPFMPRESDGDQHERKEKRFSASYNGFDVHCAVRIAAEDDEGRERLIRYCARPPFSLERIEEMKDGRISYLMKTPRRGSTRHVRAS
jgi:hypothetical protein